MFLEFYGLREQPFGVTPDPRFLYFGSSHREALASLLYSIESKRGFSALVAEPGMGKTSLLFQMLNSLKNSARTAFLFQTDMDSNELLHSLLHDLGITSASRDPIAMRDALNQGLLQEFHAGRQVVVVIDEAQNLNEKVLETVRLLSNFETSTQKLMHIVLSGQPGLATKLLDAGMTQLRQRVSTIIHLEPFQPEETAKYIEHRLRAAGLRGPSIFSAEALHTIARISHGIPRNINSLCFQALSIGFATQSKRIGPEIMREVALDLDFTPRQNDRSVAREPDSWPPPHMKPPEFAAPIGQPVWETVAPMPQRLHPMKWVAAFACFVVLPTSIIALSDSKFGLTETLPGRASTQIVNAVLSSRDPSAEFIPPWPDKLKPPLPPPIVAASANTSATSLPDDQADLPSENASSSDEKLDEPDRAPSKPSTISARNRQTDTTGRKTNKFGDTREEPNRFHTAPYGVPTRVQVLRSETLFQFALELYGQSSWPIIEAICAANPQVHGPYSVLSTGQWIQLPRDLETVTAKYNSHETFGRSR